MEQFGAADEQIFDTYYDMAFDAVGQRAKLQSNVDSVTPLLLKMLRSDRPNAKVAKNPLAEKAEELLSILGVFDSPEGLREKKEQIAMWKEELGQRRVTAILEAKDPANKKKAAKKKPKKRSATKGKKGKKGKKKGGKKGAKKGGVKKKKK